jgi:hypothetical protein
LAGWQSIIFESLSICKQQGLAGMKFWLGALMEIHYQVHLFDWLADFWLGAK